MSSAETQGAAVKPFLERLAEGVVVCDGAMGTMLYARGVFVNRCFDELNLSNPDLVRASTRSTSTPAPTWSRPTRSARTASSSGPHGFEAQVGRSTARARASRARRRGGRALVAGSIGPLGKPLEPFGNIPFADAVAAYREQAEGLVEGGVDLFLVETMPSLDQARAALDAVRVAVATLPVVVSLTFTEEGTTFYGDKPEDVVRDARGLGRAGGRRQLQPGPAADAGDRAAHGGRGHARQALGHAQRRRAGAGGRPLRLPLHARVHGLLRAALHRRRREPRGRLLRHHARAHPQPGALGAHGAAGARGGPWC